MLFLNPGCTLCPHDSFQYPALPKFKDLTSPHIEIRERMWESCFKTSSNVCILPSGFDWGTTPILEVHNPYTPVPGTSTVVRQTLLEDIPETRPYDPEQDMLYIDSDNFYSFCQACGRTDWPSATKHLALALPVTDRGAWLPIAMRYLPQMESISIVLPTCKVNSEVDRLEPVELPKSTSRVLRSFTDNESDNVRVTADFWAEVMGNRLEPEWEHFVWTKSLGDFVQSVRDALTLNARQEKPPFWNYETDSLGLKFEVVCFEETGSGNR